MNDDCGESRDTFITSTKRRFCVLQNGESPRYHCPELPGRLPALPPFHPPSTTEAPITTPLAGNVSSPTQPGDMTTTVFTLGNDTVTGTVTQLEETFPPINETTSQVTQLEETFPPINETTSQVYAAITDPTLPPNNDTSTQDCCSPQIITIMVVILIIAFIFVLLLIYFRYRRKRIVQEKYTPSKAEKANGTGQAAAEEGVPLRNWKKTED